MPARASSRRWPGAAARVGKAMADQPCPRNSIALTASLSDPTVPSTSEIPETTGSVRSRDKRSRLPLQKRCSAPPEGFVKEGHDGQGVGDGAGLEHGPSLVPREETHLESFGPLGLARPVRELRRAKQVRDFVAHRIGEVGAEEKLELAGGEPRLFA